MGKVLLLIDNSNIFIGGMDAFNDSAARFSYTSFEKLCAEEDEIVEKHMAGSAPSSSNVFWARMKDQGYNVHTYERIPAGYGHTKEKGVDTILVVKAVRAIERIKPDRVVLLTGDCDFISIATLRDEMRGEYGHTFTLDVWSFENSLSSQLKNVADRTFLINDFQDELIYFQNSDGSTEDFVQHNTRIKEEKARARAAEEARARAAEEARARAAEEARARAAEEARARAAEEAKAKSKAKAWAVAGTIGMIGLSTIIFIVKKGVGRF